MTAPVTNAFNPPRPQQWLWIMALALLVVVGTAFRLNHLGQKSLWADELASIASAQGNRIDPVAYQLANQHFDPQRPIHAREYLAKASQGNTYPAWGQTAEALKTNVHPPMFFWMTQWAIHQWGLSPQALRLLPVVFGVLGIVAIAVLGTQLGGLGLGLLSAGLLALSGYQIGHAQDARPYTLVVLMAITAASLVWDLLRKTSESSEQTQPLPKTQQGWIVLQWGLLTVCLTIGLLSQYLFALYWLFIVGWGLLWAKGNSGFQKGMVLSLMIQMAIGYAWLPYFLDQREFLNQAGHYSDAKGLWDAIQVPELVWRAVSDFVVTGVGWMRLVLLIVVVVSVLAIGLSTWQQRQKMSVRERLGALMAPLPMAVWFCLSWLGVVLAGQIALDVLQQANTLSVKRYLILLSPAVYLLLGMVLLWWLKQQAWWMRCMGLTLSGLLCAVMIFNSVDVIQGRRMRSEDFASAAQLINQQAQPGDVVLVHKSGAMAVAMAYYLNPETPMLGLDPDDPLYLQHQIANSMVSTQAQRTPTVWTVYSHSAKSTQRTVDALLAKRHYRKQFTANFPGVELHAYQ